MQIEYESETGGPALAAKVSRWSLLVGGVLALLGFLAVAAPWAAATAVAMLCGIALVTAGASQVAMTAGTFTWRGFWLTLACGVLSIVAGVGMLVLPQAGVEALVTFLAIILLFEAAAKLSAAFVVPSGFPWGWLVLDGALTAILGAILLTAKPAAAEVLLGIFVGVNLLSSSAMFLGAGWSLRQAGKLPDGFRG